MPMIQPGGECRWTFARRRGHAPRAKRERGAASMSGISIEIPGLEGRFDKICMVYGPTGISTMRLHEIPESEAPTDIAVIYADIRRCMRLPLVNLIYRHLATMPDVLPWVWGAVPTRRAIRRIGCGLGSAEARPTAP